MNDTQKTIQDPPFAALPENTFDGRALAKTLLRATPAGALATLARETAFPFATLTSLATAEDGSPILLLSELAHHTKNLRADPRASLLLTQGGKGDPLAHPRLTLVGRLAPSDAPRDRARFLRRHPKAELYADFPDFHFWRMDIAAVHLNGGFARAADYPGRDILIAPAPELAAMEVALLAEINAWTRDERGALAASAGEDGALHWRAVGLDAEGLDLAAPQQTARLTFDSAVPSPENWSATIKKLSSSQNSVA